MIRVRLTVISNAASATIGNTRQAARTMGRAKNRRSRFMGAPVPAVCTVSRQKPRKLGGLFRDRNRRVHVTVDARMPTALREDRADDDHAAFSHRLIGSRSDRLCDSHGYAGAVHGLVGLGSIRLVCGGR